MHATNRNFPDVIISLKRRDDQLQRRVEFTFGRRNFFQNRVHERLKVSALVFHIFLGNARLRRRVNDGEVQLFIVGVELHEKFEHFVVNFIDARFGAVNFIYHDDWLELVLQSFAQDVFGLRHGTFEGVDQKQNAVDHVQHALDLAAEIRVTGGVHDIYLHALVKNRRVL